MGRWINNRTVVVIVGVVLAIRDEPAVAQQVTGGNVATSTVGQVGQRQTLEEASSVEPMARINTRIQNRIQSRLRTRIDRDYSPNADGTSPFETAIDRTRITGNTRRH